MSVRWDNIVTPWPSDLHLVLKVFYTLNEEMTGSVIFFLTLRIGRNPLYSNYHMLIKNCQAIQKLSNLIASLTLGLRSAERESETIMCDTLILETTPAAGHGFHQAFSKHY